MAYLNFITDERIIAAVDFVVETINDAEMMTDKKLHDRVIDPFSALFHGAAHSLSVSEWVEQEKVRQAQKSMQNAIGAFHQRVLGSLDGWEDLGHGGGLDIQNSKRKIIAEIKNKYNTTKGNHKVAIYDDIKTMLHQSEYAGYTGYYVEVIPEGRKVYNAPFTPSDNKRKQRRPVRKNIRKIDGKSFYALATGQDNALEELFKSLPILLHDRYGYRITEQDAMGYFGLYQKAFSTE